MNIYDLEAFVAFVETGSVVAAAARLHLTQPGVTRRIQSLEQFLGAPLLDRRSKPPKPTPAGREAYEYSLRVLNSVREMTGAFGPDAEPAGEFRVGLSVSLGDRALTHPIGFLRRRYPKLKLHASAAWSHELLKNIEAGTQDAAAVLLSANEEPPQGLSAKPLGRRKAIVVAARDSAVRSRVSLSDLAGHPWIMNNDGCVFRRAVKSALIARRLPFETAVDAAGSELQLSLVAEGVGLGVVLEDVFHRSAHREALKVITVSDFKLAAAFWVVSQPCAGRLAEPIACFREKLKEALELETNGVESRNRRRGKSAA